jgi:myosin heavy subunit
MNIWEQDSSQRTHRGEDLTMYPLQITINNPTELKELITKKSNILADLETETRSKIESIKIEYKNQLKKAHLSAQDLSTKYDEKCEEITHQKHVISHYERKLMNLTNELSRKSEDLIQFKKKVIEDEDTIEKLRQQVSKLQSSSLLKENTELKQKIIYLQSLEREEELKKIIDNNLNLLSEREGALSGLKLELIENRNKLLQEVEMREEEFRIREVNFFRMAEAEYNKIQKLKGSNDEIDELTSNLDEAKFIIEDFVRKNELKDIQMNEQALKHEDEKKVMAMQLTSLQKEFDEFKKSSVREPIRKTFEELHSLAIPLQTSPRLVKSPQKSPQLSPLRKPHDLKSLSGSPMSKSPLTPLMEPRIMEKVIRGIKDEYLDLSNQKLSSIEFLQLCVSLGENRNVKILNISNIGLSNRNIHHLTSMLVKNKVIVELNLDGNVIGDWKAFDLAIRGNQTLKRIIYASTDPDFSLLQERLGK